jgi:two-component system nitrate/nitrite response regulator NarL
MRAIATPESARLRTVIVEDDPVISRFIQTCISRHKRAEFIGAFSCLQDLLCATDLNPDVLLLDLGLPDIGGLDSIPLLRARFSAAKLIVITGSQSEGMVLGALREGASGYIVKTGSSCDVAVNVDRVLDGDTVISRPALDTLLSALRSETSDLNQLTKRERETLLLLRSGQSYKQAAHTMGVSVNTLRTHVRTLYRKLGVRSIVEASTKTQAAGVEPATRN